MVNQIKIIMKELSIEEKAKRYDEALASMQDCIPDENGLVHVRPEEIFPALKESEDEKIRKALIAYFSDEDESYDGIPYPNILVWLEKQGGQKPAWSEEDEVKINRIVTCLENLNVADNDILLKDVDWLKSLRPQSQWKPSDEQIKTLNKIIFCTYNANNIEDKKHIESLYNDLKKLTEG